LLSPPLSPFLPGERLVRPLSLYGSGRGCSFFNFYLPSVCFFWPRVSLSSGRPFTRLFFLRSHGRSLASAHPDVTASPAPPSLIFVFVTNFFILVQLSGPSLFPLRSGLSRQQVTFHPNFFRRDDLFQKFNLTFPAPLSPYLFSSFNPWTSPVAEFVL